jgi:hypothetical protein
MHQIVQKHKVKEEEISSFLSRAVNHLLLHASFIDNLGLMSGKMGIAICFYHLSRKTRSEIHENYAGVKALEMPLKAGGGQLVFEERINNEQITNYVPVKKPGCAKLPQILVMEKGRIVEKGTHSDWVILGGAYFNLVKDQLGL